MQVTTARFKGWLGWAGLGWVVIGDLRCLSWRRALAGCTLEELGCRPRHVWFEGWVGRGREVWDKHAEARDGTADTLVGSSQVPAGPGKADAPSVAEAMLALSQRQTPSLLGDACSLLPHRRDRSPFVNARGLMTLSQVHTGSG